MTVDSAENVGWETSLALDADGHPHISYFDNTNGDLKYAAWNGTGWDVVTVDSAGDVGWETSLALDVDGDPHISYHDNTNDDLKYAYVHTPKAELTVEKVVSGSGAPSDWSFGFTGALGAISLTDESPTKTGRITPGTIAVNETNPLGYATTAACSNGTTSTTGQLSVPLADGDDVTCTFTNTICQGGTYSDGTMWTCVAASPGYTAAGLGLWYQVACSPGTFQPLSGSIACQPAIPGHYVPGEAATAQTACDPGTYQPGEGASACYTADPGYYAPGQAAMAQTACPAGTTSPPGSDSIDDCVSLAPDIYMSAKTAGTTDDGEAFGPEDILKWDGSDGSWSVWFDGSQALLMPGNKKAKHNINAFWLPGGGDDDVVMAFAQNRRFVPDITVPVDGTDLVGWGGAEFDFYFDGSDVGLEKKGSEKIDGLHILDGSDSPINDGNCLDYMLISTQGPGKVPNYGGGTLKFGGEDVLGFCLTQWGLDTAGYWHLVVDGSAVGLPKNATNGLSMDDDGRKLYLTTSKAVDLGGGVAGGHSMIYAYDLIDGTFSGPHFSAAANGLPKQVTGLQVDGSLP